MMRLKDNNNRLLLASLLFTGLLAIIGSAFGFSSTAQDAPEVTREPGDQGMIPITLEPTLQAQYHATDEAYAATWEAVFRDRTIFDFRIAYLIAADAAADSVVSAQAMGEVLGAIPVHSWDEFIRLDAQSPVRMLIIHASMLDQVDRAWTHHAFRNSIYIIGINLRERQLAEVVGNACHRVGEKELLDFAENTFLYFEYAVWLEDPSYREAVDRAYLEECRPNRVDTGGKPALIGTGTFRTTIYGTEDLEHIKMTLLFETVNHNLPKSDPVALPTAPQIDMRGN